MIGYKIKKQLQKIELIPSGENFTVFAGLVWPLNTCNGKPSENDQVRIVRSSENDMMLGGKLTQ